jgi:hypothetical protein
MTTLLDIHRNHFNSKAGTFDHKAFAGMTAEHLRRWIGASLQGIALFDSRNVQVNGKHEFTIEFPRIRHVWWPKENTAEALKAEFMGVSNLFKEHLK